MDIPTKQLVNLLPLKQYIGFNSKTKLFITPAVLCQSVTEFDIAPRQQQLLRFDHWFNSKEVISRFLKQSLQSCLIFSTETLIFLSELYV